MERWSIDGAGAAVELEAGTRSPGSARVRRYAVGQRVFGRHGATQQYFAGRVVAADHAGLFPYLIDAGGPEPLHVVASELQSDLPGPGATADDLLAWLRDGVVD